MAKALTKKQLDDPARWRVFDRWHDAQLWGALNGVFDLKEDLKVMAAFHENRLDFVKKATEKRITKVGKGKPKFKKVPPKKIGLAAVGIKGSKAYAGSLLNEKIFGKPKKVKPEPKTKKVKKKAVVKTPHKNPENPPDPTLPQTIAHEQAKKKIKKGETFLYMFTLEPPLTFIAVYAKNGKKTQRKITAVLPPVDEKVEERKERYGNRVAMYHAIKDATTDEPSKPKRVSKVKRDGGKKSGRF